MRRTMMILAIVPTFLYAAYNPFFDGDQPKPKPVIATVKPEARQNITILYYGFVESAKGKFALVKFDDKNIIIRNNDSLYLGERIFKVKKITSNQILFADRHGRIQTVYFSSAEGRQ